MYLTTSCDFMQESFKILNDIFNRVQYHTADLVLELHSAYVHVFIEVVEAELPP